MGFWKLIYNSEALEMIQMNHSNKDFFFFLPFFSSFLLFFPFFFLIIFSVSLGRILCSHTSYVIENIVFAARVQIQWLSQQCGDTYKRDHKLISLIMKKDKETADNGLRTGYNYKLKNSFST